MDGPSSIKSCPHAPVKKGLTTMDIQQSKRWAESHCDVFIDLVRIYLGIGLCVKGIYFMSHQEYLQNLLRDSGDFFIAPVTIAHYVIPVHIFGGLLLAAGLLTRIAALVQLPILLGAIFWVYLPKMVAVEPRQNLESSALVFFLMLLILIFGAGRWSVDNFLSRRQPPDFQPQPSSA